MASAFQIRNTCWYIARGLVNIATNAPIWIPDALILRRTKLVLAMRQFQTCTFIAELHVTFVVSEPSRGC
jgi:hypothetical protein